MFSCVSIIDACFSIYSLFFTISFASPVVFTAIIPFAREDALDLNGNFEGSNLNNLSSCISRAFKFESFFISN